MPDLYSDFLSSADTLRVYMGDMLVFSSKKDRLLPLMDYLAAFGNMCQEVIIYDRVMGNAAASLSVMAHAGKVFSPLGSELAVQTLEKYEVEYHLNKIAPCIMRDDGLAMCPMEEISQGKSPAEFYRVMKAKLAKQPS
jgi:hypothetical protein